MASSSSTQAQVCGDAEVYGNAQVCGDAKLTKKAGFYDDIYKTTVTDNHIKMGCEQRTIQEWIAFLESEEVIRTKRNTKKFKVIESTLKAAIAFHKYQY